jgi:hypothetical protein
VFDVFTEEPDHRGQGILIGINTEIQGSAEKIPGAVGKKKTQGRGCISSYIINKSIDIAVGIKYSSFNDIIGLNDVFISQGTNIFGVGHKVILKGFIGYMQHAFVPGKFQVNPAGLRIMALVGNHRGINRIFETVITGAVINSILFFRKVYPKVAPGLGRIVFPASGKKK